MRNISLTVEDIERAVVTHGVDIFKDWFGQRYVIVILMEIKFSYMSEE